VAGLLYRAAREALRNVGEHARADRVEVVVALSARQVTLTVSDDGVGCDPAATAATVGGLAALRAAVAGAAGTLGVTGTPGHGTSVAVALPLPLTRPAA
jgi:signal transduction histidine kinase